MNPSHTFPISHHKELVALVAGTIAGTLCGAGVQAQRAGSARQALLLHRPSRVSLISAVDATLT